MADINTIIIEGNLTRDPELRYAGETAVCDFSVAANNRKKKGDQWVNDPAFISCTVWENLATKVSENLHKGDRVVVSGKLEMDQWEQDGQKRSKLKIRVFGVTPCAILGFQDSLSGGGGGQSDAPAAPAAPPVTDCPF